MSHETNAQKPSDLAIQKVETQFQEENKAVYIDLHALAKDILEGDVEWFERIAKRELQKLESTGTFRV